MNLLKYGRIIDYDFCSFHALTIYDSRIHQQQIRFKNLQILIIIENKSQRKQIVQTIWPSIAILQFHYLCKYQQTFRTSQAHQKNNLKMISKQDINNSMNRKIMSQEAESVIQQYEHFFRDSLDHLADFTIDDISHHDQLQYAIKAIDDKSDYFGLIVNNQFTYVEFLQSKMYGLQCCYEVIIGKFYLTVNVLNVPYSTDQSKDQKQQTLGKGAFGIVKLAEADGIKMAVKRLLFHNSEQVLSIPGLLDSNDKCQHHKIRKAIEQYAIYKICSMLEIGPKVYFNENYDLICYNNGIEFYMELCEDPEGNLQSGYETDLKDSVVLLHKFNFVHNDIKPSNILYSPSLGKLVLTDFGLTHPISEDITEKTLTGRKGTIGYFCPQMANLPANKKGLINLYYNDMYALRQSLKKLQQSFLSQSSSSSSFTSNQLSYIHRTNLSSSEQFTSQQKSVYDLISTSSDTNSSKGKGNDEENIFSSINSSLGFYMMRTVYRLLRNKSESNQTYWEYVRESEIDKAKMLRQQTIDQAFKNEKNGNLKDIVTQMVNQLMQCYSNLDLCYISSVRNTLRTFGEFSEEFHSKLHSKQIQNLQSVDRESLKSINERLIKKPLPIEDKDIDLALVNMFRNMVFFNNLRRLKKDLKFVIDGTLQNKIKLKQRKNYFPKTSAKAEDNNTVLKTVLKSIITLLLSNNIQIQYFPTLTQFISQVWELSNEHQEFGELEEIYLNQLQANNTIKFKDKCLIKYNMLRLVYKAIVCTQFYYLCAFSSLFHPFYELGCKKFAHQQIFQHVIETRKQLHKKFCDSITLENINEQENKQLKYMYFYIIIQQTGIHEILLQNKQKPDENCLNLLDSLIVFFDADIHFAKLKEEFLKKFLSVMLSSKQYFKKENLSQPNIDQRIELLKKIQQTEEHVMFYKENSRKSGQFYHLMALHQFSQKNYQECVAYLRREIQLMEESMFITENFEKLLPNYSNLVLSYMKLNENELAQKGIRRYLELMQQTKQFNGILYVKMLFIHIQLLCKINKIKETRTQMEKIIKQDFLQTRNHKQIYLPKKYRKFLMINNDFCEKYCKNQSITLKKIVIKVIQPFLPLYLKVFRELNLNVASYYIFNKQKYQSFPYIWKYFYKFPLLNVAINDKNQDFFQRLNSFATFLIEFELEKQAVIILELYIGFIPDECHKLKDQIFRNLAKASRKLKGMKSHFYNLVFNKQSPPYQSSINHDLFLIELKTGKYGNISSFLKQVYLKKVKIIKPVNEEEFEGPNVWLEIPADGKYSEQEFHSLIRQKRKIK